MRTVSDNSFQFGYMMRTKFGSSHGVLVETNFETPSVVNHGEDIAMPYTIMTYQQCGYIGLVKVSKSGFIWSVCGKRTHYIGNIYHGAAFLASDPDYYECLLVGTYGLHYAQIKKAVANSKRRPEWASDIQEQMLFDIEIVRLWTKEGDDMVYVHPISLETDGSQIVMVVCKTVDGLSGLQRDFKHIKIYKLRIIREPKPAPGAKSFDELNRPRYSAALIQESDEIKEPFRTLAQGPKLFPGHLLIMMTAKSLGLFNVKTMKYEAILLWPHDPLKANECP